MNIGLNSNNFDVSKHRNKLIPLFILSMLSVFSVSVFADSKILINEFLIDPQPQQVELFNTGTDTTNVSGWYLDDSGGTAYFTIPPSSLLYPNACLVFSGNFNLNKTSADSIRLFDGTAPPASSESKLVDAFSYKSSSGSGISYGRIPDGENIWSSMSSSLGSFNSSLKSCMISPTPIPTATPTPTSIPPVTPTDKPTPTLSPIPVFEPTPTPISYEKIFISEVMVNPQTGNNEWLELFNANDHEVQLVGWYLDDVENAGSSPKVFSLNIPAKQYGIYELSSPMFNNDKDTIRLLDFNKNVKDSFEYVSSRQDITFARISFDSDNYCLQKPSKGSDNYSCIEPASSNITPTVTITPFPTAATMPSIHTISVNPPPKTISRTQTIAKTSVPIISAYTGASVLGVHIGGRKNPIKYIPYLSFLSSSYSLLTILSVLIKMKKGLWKK